MHIISRTILRTVELYSSVKMTLIEKALTDLKSQKCLNYSKTTCLFEINRSTLSQCHRDVAGSRVKKISNSKLLTLQQEITLIKYIN